MEASTFRKKLLESLDRLTDKDVERIRSELDLHHDYEVDQNGVTSVVDKNIDTLQQDRTETLFSTIDMSLPKGDSNNNFGYEMNIDSIKNWNLDFETSHLESKLKVYIKKKDSFKNDNYYGSKNSAMRKAA